MTYKMILQGIRPGGRTSRNNYIGIASRLLAHLVCLCRLNQGSHLSIWDFVMVCFFCILLMFF